jgi:hypothetical protein
MPLGRRAEPFDHPDWLFELKYDAFRALASVERERTQLSKSPSLRVFLSFGRFNLHCFLQLELFTS